ncbi:hypothetical protein [Tardiphaga sp. 709]|uniref:hypothetical protein n=1 Tax=Tardiphaga sp. 709 TaxID=3076039 RepID=UPI0028E37ADC|nr:hypothetical protein [Tardiphaga sp. 709]WNV11749.1 hypothetical protein RSO67_11530 [Tardiphaga sp. 709]
MSAMRTYSYERGLHWSECDPGGIVFSPNYARRIVDGRSEMFFLLGFDPNKIDEARARRGLPVLRLVMGLHRSPTLHQIVTHKFNAKMGGDKSLSFRRRFQRSAIC